MDYNWQPNLWLWIESIISIMQYMKREEWGKILIIWKFWSSDEQDTFVIIIIIMEIQLTGLSWNMVEREFGI